MKKGPPVADAGRGGRGLHGRYAVHTRTQWVDSTNLENEVKAAAPAKYQDALKALEDADGILVPGGFGKRGIEGMIVAANWARVHKKPYLGTARARGRARCRGLG